MYIASIVTNSMNDGTLSYPPIEEKGDLKLDGGKGMSFELRYVDIISVWGIFIFTVYQERLVFLSRQSKHKRCA